MNNLEPIEYNGGVIWVNDNIKQADEGYNVYLSSANVYFTKGIHLLEPFNKEKDHFGLFYPKEANDFSQYITLKQDIETADIGNGYKFCNVKYLKRIVAQSPNLSIPNIPYIEVEEDVDEKIWDSVPSINKGDGIEQMHFGDGYYAGYKAASTKKWSDDDMRKAIRQGEINEGCTACRKTDEEFLLSLQPKIKSIEIEVGTEYYVNKEWKSVLLPSEWDDTNPTRQVPIAYQKDGKTFLKVKTVTYD